MMMSPSDMEQNCSFELINDSMLLAKKSYSNQYFTTGVIKECGVCTIMPVDWHIFAANQKE